MGDSAGAAGWRRALERVDSVCLGRGGAPGGAGARARRAAGAAALGEAARLLRLPPRVAAAGRVLLQRFLCRPAASGAGAPGLEAAWRTALWIASKADDLCVAAEQRPLQDFLQVFYRLEGRKAQARGGSEGGGRPGLLLWNNPALQRWREEIVRTEKVMLRELGFVVGVELPHKVLFFLLSDRFLGASPQLRQEALNVANDSLRTALCVQLHPSALACGSIFFAARLLREPLPETPTPWWEAAGVPREEVLEVCQGMLEFYAEEEARLAARAGGGEAGVSGAPVQIADANAPREPAPGLAGDFNAAKRREVQETQGERDRKEGQKGGGKQDFRRERGQGRGRDSDRDRDFRRDRDSDYRRDRDSDYRRDRDGDSRRDRDSDSRRDRDSDSRRDRDSDYRRGRDSDYRRYRDSDYRRDRDSGYRRDRDSDYRRDRDRDTRRDRDSNYRRDRDSDYRRDRDSGYRRDRDGAGCRGERYR